MKREIIDVTAADIELAREKRKARLAWMREAYPGYEGVAINPSECPVACALNRRYRAEQAWATPDRLRVLARESRRPSQALRAFMRRWDGQWLAQPARFLVVWED